MRRILVLFVLCLRASKYRSYDYCFSFLLFFLVGFSCCLSVLFVCCV